jgi:tetratricopeptide (TPR) repeat protein
VLSATSAALAALATGVIAWIAFAHHPIGDYFTESDFYGYAWGARLIQHGRIDFSRYSVVGPLYELLLAVLAPLARDAFRAGELISIASAATTLLVWRQLLRRRISEAAGVWVVVLLAVNPHFARYGYSATTDMLAVALQSLTVAAVLLGRGGRAPLIAGLCAALAVLTRYSALYLLPAAIACYLWWPEPGRARGRAVGWFALGFAALVVPWAALSLAAGHMPGSNLIGSFSFYVDPSQKRNVQDVLPSGVQAYRSLGAMLAHEPGALIGRLLANIPSHLRSNLVSLIGVPAAIACGIALLVVLRDGSWRRLLPLGVFGGFAFLSLVPVFYSDRYALPLAPYDLAIAAAGIASPRLVPRAMPALRLAWVAALVPVVLSFQASMTLQRWIRTQLPLEVVESGRVLRGLAPQGGGAISRKMHLWYYSGLDPVAFPRVPTLAALAAYARDTRARYIYFSWYEAELRPEFWYLLDSTATVPGLERIPFPSRNPALLFRIGSEFGRDPAWLSNDSLRSLHVARAQVQALEDRYAWSAHFVLGEEARGRGDLSAALDHYLAATRGNPGLALAWQRAGGTLLALGRIEEARGAYERARALVPGDAVTLIGIGWTQMRSGRADLAARTWRPLVSSTHDPATLRAMAEAFDRAGDAAARDQARRTLAALPGGGR